MTTEETIREGLRAARRRAGELNTESADVLLSAVKRARDAGWSYAKIGEALGITRQAAWENYSKKVDKDTD